MKPILSLILVCLLFTACGSQTPPETTVPETTAPTTASTAAPISYPVPSEGEMPVSDTAPDWGLTITSENVQSMSCTLRYAQSGGNPTGELSTGAYFVLEVYDGAWKPAANLHPDEKISWNSMAYPIPLNGEMERVEDWSFLHGPLMPGWYRIGKEITDFRGPGDYDSAIFYTYFEITR